MAWRQTLGGSMEPKKPRGFAAMTPERRREVQSLGGKSAQAKGTGHRWTTSEQAREAGKRSAAVATRDRERMSEIGKLGGHPTHAAVRDAVGAQAECRSQTPENVL